LAAGLAAYLLAPRPSSFVVSIKRRHGSRLPAVRLEKETGVVSACAEAVLIRRVRQEGTREPPTCRSLGERNWRRVCLRRGCPHSSCPSRGDTRAAYLPLSRPQMAGSPLLRLGQQRLAAGTARCRESVPPEPRATLRRGSGQGLPSRLTVGRSTLKADDSPRRVGRRIVIRRERGVEGLRVDV